MHTDTILPPIRRKVLFTLASLTEYLGCPPTVRELATSLQRCPSTVFAHLEQLERDGYIYRRNGTPRSIRLTHQGNQLIFGSRGPGQNEDSLNYRFRHRIGILEDLLRAQLKLWNNLPPHFLTRQLPEAEAIIKRSKSALDQIA